MLVKVFVLGRPGSGKTTAFRRISAVMKEIGWPASRIRDYGILQNMSKDEIEGKKFRPTEYGGFDVIDFSVLDTALVEVERQVKLRMLTAKEKELVVIEFARSDYESGLEPFSPEFRQNTHILFVDADVETCIQRIHQRVANGLVADSHFVSDHILRGYYGKDNKPYIKYLAELSAEARKEGKSTMGIVKCVENTRSLNNFHAIIDDFIDDIIEELHRCDSEEFLPLLTPTNEIKLAISKKV